MRRARTLALYRTRHLGADSDRARIDARLSIYYQLAERYSPAIVARHLDQIRDVLNRSIGQPAGRPFCAVGRIARPGRSGHDLNHYPIGDQRE